MQANWLGSADKLPNMSKRPNQGRRAVVKIVYQRCSRVNVSVVWVSFLKDQGRNGSPRGWRLFGWHLPFGLPNRSSGLTVFAGETTSPEVLPISRGRFFLNAVDG